MREFSTFKLLFLTFFCIIFVFPIATNASETQGTINPNAKYAWSNNVGWINFAPAKSNVQITDSVLTGSAWSTNDGWINLAPAKGGVKNNGAGQLSGSAWGEQVGWIDFSDVSINSAGKFTGTATGTVIGTLTFDCNHCDVETDWIPQSVRVQTQYQSFSGGSSGYVTTVLPNTSTVQPTISENNPTQRLESSVGLSGSPKKTSVYSSSTMVNTEQKLFSTSTKGTNINHLYQTSIHVMDKIGLAFKNTFTFIASFTQNLFQQIYHFLKTFWRQLL